MRFIGNVEKDAQVRAVASGALSTGDTVVVNSDGTVSVITEGTENFPAVTGSSVLFNNQATLVMSSAYDANADRVVVFYMDGGNANYPTAVVGTVTGTSISFGTAATFGTVASPAGSYPRCVAGGGFVLVGYPNSGNSNYLTSAQGVVSGTSITFEAPVALSSIQATYIAGSYSSSSDRFVFSFHSGAYPSDTGQYVVSQAGSTNLTSENFLGFADSGYANGQSAAINSTCTVDRNQSGLTAGQTYYVQTDGSLGTTAADPSVVAGTAISSTEIIVKG